jgi:hypothetical protein
VQCEVLYFVQRDAVRDGRVLQHFHVEVTARAGWRHGPTIIVPKPLYCLRNGLVKAVRFYFYRVVNSFYIAVGDSAACHERSLPGSPPIRLALVTVRGHDRRSRQTAGGKVVPILHTHPSGMPNSMPTHDIPAKTTVALTCAGKPANPLKTGTSD